MPNRPLLCGLLLIGLAATSASAQSRPDRIVLGYSAAWHDSTCPPQFYNYNALTHLARSFLTPHPDGSITVPDGYFNKTMESLAHQHHVKLLMSIGGEAENADNWVSLASHPEYLKRFADKLDNLMSANGYDGIDIDWEPSPLTDSDGVAYTTLLKTLRARFPKAVLTTALPAGDYWISHFSWPDVLANVDYINVMVYDYSGGWGGRAAYASNLFPPGAYSPEPQYSADEGMRNLIENHKVPAAKLLMGMTFWASRFAVDHIGDHFPVNAPQYSMNITYSQTLVLLADGNYRDLWDDKAAMPYLEKTGGGSVVCYENPKSIARKCEYAKKMGCGGVMIWHVGADLNGRQAPLMDAVAQSCGVAPQTFSRDILEKQIGDLHGDGGKLSTSSDDELQATFLRWQKDWGLKQDQLWKEGLHR